MKTVITHDGTFHTDEVMAIAILTLAYPKIKIIRTRNEKKFSKADLRIDAGDKYNPLTGDFDHHQKEFKEKRNNGIPYASAGLIWKHYGNKITKSKKVLEYIDKKIIQGIDAGDNGIQTYSYKNVEPYTLYNLIISFNLDWKLNKMTEDQAFSKAVDLMKDVLKREINSIQAELSSEKKLLKLISKTNKEYLVIDSKLFWRKTLINKSKIKFVIRQQEDKIWFISAVPIKENSFESRALFPKKWGGLSTDKLPHVSGVEDALFCHKNLFAASAKSKEGAIQMVELALEK